MISTTNFISTNQNMATVKRENKTQSSIIDKYTAYINSEKQEQVYWFLKAIIIIPCVIMVPSIIAMHAAVGNHVPFVGVCMMLFFLNVIVHIAEVKSKVYIPVYHFSIMAMILVPLIAFIINS